MKIEACIFDLDGVIVDTAKYHYKAWSRLAEELGFFFSEDHNERLKGVSRMTSLEILLEVGKIELTEGEKLKLAAKKNEWYLKFVETMTPEEILPGLIEFLDALKAADIRIALGSASKNAVLILDKINLTHYFDAIIDGTKISEAKPNPEVFLNGAVALNIDPSNCVVFEDAEAGVQAALNAKMLAIGIGSKEILHAAHEVVPGFIDFKLERLKEIAKNI